MANGVLDFEKPLVELENKIEELRKFTTEKGINFNDEIVNLENKAEQLKQDIYGNLTPYQKLALARHNERPNTGDIIKLICEDFIELHGDRLFGDDPAVIGGIGQFEGHSVTLIGHLKGRDTKENLVRNFGMPHPEGYRKALRLMQQAAKFNRPVITFIDTPGAYCGIGAEERGIGEAIARDLMAMTVLPVPVVTVIIGEGGSGGALALAVGDRVLMLEHAVFTVITPEGCASILWKDAAQAPEAATALKLTAQDLERLQIIDELLPEPLGGAHKDPVVTAKIIKEAIKRHLEDIINIEPNRLVEMRYQKLRAIGRFNV